MGEKLPGKQALEQIEAMKAFAEETQALYHKLKHQTEGHSKSIAGLNADKEDVKQRIRALLMRRVESEHPAFDEYRMNRKVSRTYEPIDPSRVKPKAKVSVDSSSSISVVATQPEEDEESVDSEKEEEQEAPTVSANVVRISVKSN